MKNGMRARNPTNGKSVIDGVKGAGIRSLRSHTLVVTNPITVSITTPAAKIAIAVANPNRRVSVTPTADSPVVRASSISRSGEAICSTGIAANASANSLAVLKRSAGVFASDFRMTRSNDAGTVSRTIRTLGTDSIIFLATIACAVEPVNGGSPPSIS